jgi:hypothetical protein
MVPDAEPAWSFRVDHVSRLDHSKANRFAPPGKTLQETALVRSWKTHREAEACDSVYVLLPWL